MQIYVGETQEASGAQGALLVAEALRQAIEKRGEAHLILATGASQFAMLEALVRADVDWQRVVCFHLDEYIGISETHPASFRGYLQERFCERVEGPKDFHWIGGDSQDPAAECERLGALIRRFSIDVACVGIGENGHLAFNDPPADFETDKPYLVVELDEACRQQQLGEGWFPTLDEVPKQAISMSVNQIMKSALIVCTVPDQRKAQAVRNTVEESVSPEVPASILQRHPNTVLLLDPESASLLSPSVPTES